MLNEFWEYKQYTDKEEFKRIQTYFLINKGGAGIPRALWIIARHDLQENRYWDTEYLTKTYDPCTPEETRAKIRQKVLSGMKKLYSDDSLIAGQYISAKGKKAWEKFIKEKKTNWEDDDFYKTVRSKNADNATNLKRILCEAVHAGPLKNYAVACNADAVDKIRKDFGYYSYKGKIGGKDKNSREAADKWDNIKITRFFKILSAWLIGKETQTEIRFTDIANWMDYYAFGISNEHWGFCYEYKGEEYKLRDVLFNDNFDEIAGSITDKYGLCLIERNSADLAAPIGKVIICEEKDDGELMIDLKKSSRPE